MRKKGIAIIQYAIFLGIGLFLVWWSMQQIPPEKWEDFKDGSVKISQIVYVERPSQKAIVLGKEGAQIRTSRMRAQAEIQKALDRRVHLFITVKVRENWQDDPERYRSWGLNFEG